MLFTLGCSVNKFGETSIFEPVDNFVVDRSPDLTPVRIASAPGAAPPSGSELLKIQAIR